MTHARGPQGGSSAWRANVANVANVASDATIVITHERKKCLVRKPRSDKSSAQDDAATNDANK